MSLLPAEFIRKKRTGGTHSAEEIDLFLSGYLQNEIPDYQMAAWLMAVCFQGMKPEEMGALTKTMMNSGEVLNFRGHKFHAVDKHSTGGIGDKTSLIISPLVAACGVPVPMMAGRGLGHTGGTLDKLESIDGFNVKLSLEQFRKQIEKVGTAIIGQTKNICPADLRIYSLRDVTGTVDSIPLICASIMSKKLAEGIEGLVLDVKFGSGAFMKTVAQAEQLARALVSIGPLREVEVVAYLSNMNRPLGRFAGNALEIQECVDILQGRLKNDVSELSLVLSAEMLILAGAASDAKSARALAEKTLSSGAAWEKFDEICRAQGAVANWRLPEARYSKELLATADGYIFSMDCEAVGLAGIELGAGRKRSEDSIDPSAGIEFLETVGAKVIKGQPLMRLYSSDQAKFIEAERRLNAAIFVDPKAPQTEPLIHSRIDSQGGARA